MRRLMSVSVLGTAVATGIAACGGGGSGDSGSGDGGGSPPPPPPTLVSYLGTTGVFAAWTDESGASYAAAPTSDYAGKKQSLRGTVDFLTGASLSQPAGVEIYKYNDGHIYGLELTSSGTPAAQQLSSESAATIDDTCTLSGTVVPGANYDYVGVYFTGDLQTPTNSSYIYRLPGPDGVCNTADDVIHMVKTGMTAAAAPIVAPGMPLATVRTAQGGITGFVVKSGTNLLLFDSNFANSVVLATFTNPIGVAVALPVGTTQGYPTGQLYVVDGDIVYVDYVAQTTSAPLFTIPNWTPTSPAAFFAASPSTLYFAINTPAAGATPAFTSIYSLPADGSAAPTAVDTEPGRVATLMYPIQGSNLLWGVVDPTYTIRSLPAGGGTAATLVTSTQNAGTFIATASTVYYETWTGSTDSTTMTITHSGTQSGIVGLDGTVIQAPLANSTFVNGGEQTPWPSDSDTTTTITPYETVFQIRGLSPVTVTNQSTGYQYTEDGIGGGSLIAIDTTSNQVVATVGTIPVSTATALSGTFRGGAHTGFLEASNPLSTQDPATRDLYLLNSQTSNSLVRVTGNL
jgi:hypothetical protein